MTHAADMGHECRRYEHRADASTTNPADDGQIKGGPVYWNRADGAGPWMYVWSDGCNHFNAYHFNGATFDTTPVSQSTLLSPRAVRRAAC